MGVTCASPGFLELVSAGKSLLIEVTCQKVTNKLLHTGDPPPLCPWVFSPFPMIACSWLFPSCSGSPSAAGSGCCCAGVGLQRVRLGCSDHPTSACAMQLVPAPHPSPGTPEALWAGETRPREELVEVTQRWQQPRGCGDSGFSSEAWLQDTWKLLEWDFSQEFSP